jgi:hypothetical protein
MLSVGLASAENTLTAFIVSCSHACICDRYSTNKTLPVSTAYQMAMMSQPRPVKICTLGESGAGKSSLIMRLTTGNFSANQVRAWSRSSGRARMSVGGVADGFARAANDYRRSVCGLDISGRADSAGNLVRLNAIAFVRLSSRYSRGLTMTSCLQGHRRAGKIRNAGSNVLSVR